MDIKDRIIEFCKPHFVPCYIQQVATWNNPVQTYRVCTPDASIRAYVDVMPDSSLQFQKQP